MGKSVTDKASAGNRPLKETSELTLGRRALLASTAALGMSAAGCLNFLTGGDSLSFEASGVSVESARLDETGYDLLQAERREIRRTVSVAGQERQLELSNYLADYRRQADGEDRGGFGLLSTPRAQVLGQALNPIAHLSPAQILQEVPNPYGTLGEVVEVETDSLTILGDDETVTAFDAIAEDGSGDRSDVRLHLARIERDADLIVAVGVYEAGRGEELNRIRQLFEGIRLDLPPVPKGELNPTARVPNIAGFHRPQLDGIPYGHDGQPVPDDKVAEWADAHVESVTLSGSGTADIEAELRVKRVDGELFVALSTDELSPADLREVVLQLDRDNSGERTDGDVRLVFDPHDSASGIPRIETLEAGGFVDSTPPVEDLAAGTGYAATEAGAMAFGPRTSEGQGTSIELRVDPEQIDGILGDSEGDESPGYVVGMKTTTEAYSTSESTSIVDGTVSADGYQGYVTADDIIAEIPVADIGLDSILVLQAIQTPANSLPLVRNKETMARVFLTSRDDSNAMDVRVSLTAVGIDDGELISLGPLHESEQVTRIPTGPDAPDSLTQVFDFELPASWSAVDALLLRAEIAQVECKGNRCDQNYLHVIGTTDKFVWVLFHETYDPTIYTIRVNEGTAKSPDKPPQSDADAMQAAFTSAYPIADPDYRDLGSESLGEQGNASDNELIMELNHLAWSYRKINTFSPPDQMFGVTVRSGGLSDSAWSNVAPQARDGASMAAWGGMSSSSREMVMAHEINHNIGDQDWWGHAPGASGCESDPPVDQTWVSLYDDDDIHEVGWYPGNGIISRNSPDFMSYCISAGVPTQWVSDYRWERLFDRFENFTPGVPKHPDAEGEAVVETPPYAAESSGRDVDGQTRPTTRLVSGLVHRDDTGELRPSFESPGTIEIPLNVPEQPMAFLNVRYLDGSTIRIPVAPDFMPNHHRGEERARTGSFTIPLTDNGTIQKLTLRSADSGAILDELRSTGFCLLDAEIHTPSAFERDLPVTVDFDLLTDAGPDTTLNKRLLYAPDGEIFLPFGSAFTDDDYPFEFTRLPGGEQAKVLLLVSDGVHTEFAMSEPFAVPHRSPDVTIDRNDRWRVEGEGHNVTVQNAATPVETTIGAPVSLDSRASDEWGRRLEGDALEWAVTDTRGSEVALDSPSGRRLEHVFRLPGTYTATVTATDPSTDLTETDAIEINVAPPSLPDAAFYEAYRDAREEGEK